MALEGLTVSAGFKVSEDTERRGVGDAAATNLEKKHFIEALKTCKLLSNVQLCNTSEYNNGSCRGLLSCNEK